MAPSIQSLLSPGERVLWSGRPYPRRLLTANDATLIPFSLIWGGVSLYWTWGMVANAAAAALSGATLSGSLGLDLLWGVPFLLLGQYMIWGRFVYKYWDRRRTTYAVTNQRVLIVRPRSVNALSIDALPTTAPPKSLACGPR